MSSWIFDLFDFTKFTANLKSFSHFVHSMLGLRLAWWCFNNVWANFVNVMLGLRLAWLHKVYHKPKILIAFHALHVGSLTCFVVFQWRVSKILWMSCWISNLLDFTKYTWDFPFSPQTNNHPILLFLHKNCTLLEITSRSNALSDSLRYFLKIQCRSRTNALMTLCHVIKINLSKK